MKNLNWAELTLKKRGISIQLNSIESILANVNDMLINLQKENNVKMGEIFVIINKLSAITDTFQNISKQLHDAQLIVEFKQTVIALQSLIKKADTTIERANLAVNETTALLKKC